MLEWGSVLDIVKDIPVFWEVVTSMVKSLFAEDKVPFGGAQWTLPFSMIGIQVVYNAYYLNSATCRDVPKDRMDMDFQMVILENNKLNLDLVAILE